MSYKRNLRIGTDLDDVLAGFFESYLQEFGEPKSNAEISKNVYKLRKNKEFWENLPKLRDIDFIPALYCTKRINSKTYTRNWLAKNRFPQSPIYQMYHQSGNKARMIKGRVDVFVDDSIYNFESMNKEGVLCLLMDAPHNQNYKTDLRIYDLKFETILEKYNKYGRKIS